LMKMPRGDYVCCGGMFLPVFRTGEKPDFSILARRGHALDVLA
jgi:hypothetical protein